MVVDRLTQPEIGAPLGWVLSGASITAMDKAMIAQLDTHCPENQPDGGTPSAAGPSRRAGTSSAARGWQPWASSSDISRYATVVATVVAIRSRKLLRPNASVPAVPNAKGAHREVSIFWRWHETSDHRPGRRCTARRECVDDGSPGPRSGHVSGVDLARGTGRDGGRLRERRGVLKNFKPGTLTDPQSLPADTYDLKVVKAGDGADGDASSRPNNVKVPGGANITVVAHLNEDGDPTLTPFVNDVSKIPPARRGSPFATRRPLRRLTCAPG